MSKWDEEKGGISLNPLTDSNQQKPTVEQMHEAYGVVFIDVTGSYNICSNLYPDIYRLVRIEANKALQVLNDNNFNAFKILFGNYYPLYSQVDYIFK